MQCPSCAEQHAIILIEFSNLFEHEKHGRIFVIRLGPRYWPSTFFGAFLPLNARRMRCGMLGPSCPRFGISTIFWHY